jgi:hypothetical protein
LGQFILDKEGNGDLGWVPIFVQSFFGCVTNILQNWLIFAGQNTFLSAIKFDKIEKIHQAKKFTGWGQTGVLF